MFYIFLFLALLGTGFGVFPIHEDFIILGAGAGIEQEVGNAFLVFAVCLLGVLISDSAIYFIGRKLGDRIFEIRFFSVFLSKQKVEKVRKIFSGHEKKILFAGRFLPGIRPVIFFTSGMSKTKFSYFAIVDFLAALIYIPFFLFLGYRFAYDLSRLIEDARRIYHFLEIALILAIVVWFVFKFSKRVFNNNSGIDNRGTEVQE